MFCVLMIHTISISTFWLLWVMLLWTLIHKYPFEWSPDFSFFRYFPRSRTIGLTQHFVCARHCAICILCSLFYLVFTTLWGSIIIPTLKLRKLRLREFTMAKGLSFSINNHTCWAPEAVILVGMLRASKIIPFLQKAHVVQILCVRHWSRYCASGAGSNAGVHNRVFITPGVLVSELGGGTVTLFYEAWSGRCLARLSRTECYLLHLHRWTWFLPDGGQDCQALSELLSWVNPVLSGDRGNKETRKKYIYTYINFFWLWKWHIIITHNLGKWWKQRKQKSPYNQAIQR